MDSANPGYIARRCYVGVVAEFLADGGVIPLEIVWTDGRRYKVDKVEDRSYIADMETGGRGLRYSIVVRGHARHLWQDDTGRWYVNIAPSAA